MSNVRASVIIPTFNREPFILRAVESAMNQTYQNAEVIVIDDASVDDTEQRLLPFLKKGLRYIRNPSRRGAAFSRNLGIQQAQGRFISFLDSDDEWHPSKLECEIMLLQRSGIVIASTGFIFVDYQTGRIIEKSPNGKKMITKKGFFENPFLTNDFTAYKDCVKSIGGFRESMWRDDYDFWARILNAGNGMYQADRLVRKHIGHADRMTLDLKRKTESTVRIYREYSRDFKMNPKAHCRILAEMGVLFLDSSYLRALTCFRKAARSAPAGLNKVLFFMISAGMMILGPRTKRWLIRCYRFMHPAHGYVADKIDGPQHGKASGDDAERRT